MEYSHHQTKYIEKYVGLRTYQHPCNSMFWFIPSFVQNAAITSTEA